MYVGTILGIAIFFFAFYYSTTHRKKIAEIILRIPIPVFVLFVLSTATFVFFEEHINCQPGWCWATPVPPTLFPIVAQVSVLGVIYKCVHLVGLKSIYFAVMPFSLFGVWLEMEQGGLQGLALSPVAAFWVLWVAISYAFVAIVPLSLIGQRAARRA